MANVFSLQGSYESTPNVGSPSLIATVVAPINQVYQLTEQQLVAGLTLDSDSPFVVPFGSLDDANVMIVQSPNGKVKATVTSADGTAQTFPVDPTLILISQSVPFTALSLTRVTGQDTEGIDVFLGQQ